MIETDTRECIAERTNRSVDQVEDTDVKLASIAAEYLERGTATDVGIITNDMAAGVCFDSVLGEHGYERAEFIDAAVLLDQVRKWYSAN